ncbi:hypothetical protein BP6252_00745 [Coleophoma cylindrospora]|uniref:Uncharacterized protein n=1 Tax=Coleophoma cylindrospora TaxID=1849047 RepID=A0A3D8SQX0_9HELO|nr:hypothetical protein BP6252_00745 [Coleophoma cylindrospora]
MAWEGIVWHGMHGLAWCGLAGQGMGGPGIRAVAWPWLSSHKGGKPTSPNIVAWDHSPDPAPEGEGTEEQKKLKNHLDFFFNVKRHSPAENTLPLTALPPSQPYASQVTRDIVLCGAWLDTGRMSIERQVDDDIGDPPHHDVRHRVGSSIRCSSERRPRRRPPPTHPSLPASLALNDWSRVGKRNNAKKHVREREPQNGGSSARCRSALPIRASRSLSPRCRDGDSLHASGQLVHAHSYQTGLGWAGREWIMDHGHRWPTRCRGRALLGAWEPPNHRLRWVAEKGAGKGDVSEEAENQLAGQGRAGQGAVVSCRAPGVSAGSSCASSARLLDLLVLLVSIPRWLGTRLISLRTSSAPSSDVACSPQSSEPALC